MSEITIKDVRDQARKTMKGYCRVCPVCDGKACSGEVPGMGGLGTGAAFRANLDALAKWRLNMRTVHDVAQPDTSVSVLGLDLAMPVMAAPIGGVSFNMGGRISEEDYVNAVLGGCKAKGIYGCTGDGAPDFVHKAAFGGITALDGHGIPFIKPWEDKELNDKLAMAEAAGVPAVGMDVDACGLITLAKMGRPVTAKGVDKLREIISRTSLKFIVKGIMTVQDAEAAADAGAAAIVVSNHGGRVLDWTPGTAEVLPEIAKAVKGRLDIFVDSGIRTGVDVLKMLALGADAVMLGRPFSIAALGGLQQGVEVFLDQLHGQLASAMVLTATASARNVDPGILRPA